MTHFQCDYCSFINLKGREPQGKEASDKLLLKLIRRANLDAFWSVEVFTVESNRKEFDKASRCLEFVGVWKEGVMPVMGPAPIKDEYGMGQAISMLVQSLDRGQNKRHVQYDTVRKMKSMYSNLWHAILHALSRTTAVRGMTKTIQSASPTNTDWFERFMKGMHRRTGDCSRPDQAISIELLLEFHRRLEEELQDARAKKDKPREREVILLGAFSTIGFAAGLRGEETVLTDLGGLRWYWKEAMTHSTPHVPLALRGRFKGELGEQWHYMPLALTSASGIEIEFWISTMVIWYEQQGITSGRAFLDTEGALSIRI
jgi:hypothetical protein